MHDITCVDHPPPYNTEVKERVQLYHYFPSGLSWPVPGWSLAFMCGDEGTF